MAPMNYTKLLFGFLGLVIGFGSIGSVIETTGLMFEIEKPVDSERLPLL